MKSIRCRMNCAAVARVEKFDATVSITISNIYADFVIDFGPQKAFAFDAGSNLPARVIGRKMEMEMREKVRSQSRRVEGLNVAGVLRRAKEALEDGCFYVVELPFTGGPGDVARTIVRHEGGYWYSMDEANYEDGPLPVEEVHYTVVRKIDLWPPRCRPASRPPAEKRGS